MTIEVAQVIDGKYRVVKLLGKGGMGAVYLAEHMIIGKRVALKVLLGSVAENEVAVSRFEREAQAAGRIGSEHILEIFDFGSLPDGARYMVCEFLDGETMASRLERSQRLPPAAMLPLVRQLLVGLGAAHQAGVVHRDLKPENVFILKQKAGWQDFVKIIDFGISKFQPLSTGDGMQMTATGIVVGTPCYLSPEQARGSRDADARSDLYAVGVILYECVTGKLPFHAQNVNDLLFKIVLESPQPLLEAAPDVDPAFAQLVEIAMARDPENRFQNAEAFIAALDSWAAERGLRATGPIALRSDTGANAAAARSSDANLGVTNSTRSLAPTPGTWADSQVSANIFAPKPRSNKLAIIGAGLGVLLVAGAGFALFGRGGDKSPAAASAVAPAVSTVPAAKPVAPPSVEVAPTPTEIPTTSPGNDGFGDPPPLDQPITPAAKPQAAIRRPNPAPAAAPRRPTPAPAAPRTPAAAPAAAPPAAGGHQKRDFGY